MAFAWIDTFRAWRARRQLAQGQRLGRRFRRQSGSVGSLKLRSPAILALVLIAAYGGTWVLLMRSSLPVQNPAEVEKELACLALNIYHEARGEPSEGKLAVGHVVMNRVADPGFPSSVCAVVHQGGYRRRAGCQFSWWCDGRADEPFNLPAWEDSLLHARKVLWRATEDPSEGALWYHADYVSPGWKRNKVQGPKIGKHIFYLAQRP